MPSATLAKPIVAAIRAIDPEQPVVDIRTMVQVLDDQLTPQRFSALLLGVFACVALLLAAVGIYSVLSYIVRGHSREIGIRTALGARTVDVLRMVIVEGMTPTLVGIAAGTIAALASARVMESLVFGVSASDPLTLAAVGVTLALVALLASMVPAYVRAARPRESLARGLAVGRRVVNGRGGGRVIRKRHRSIVGARMRSAAYVMPHLRAGVRLLDVGCGRER